DPLGRRAVFGAAPVDLLGCVVELLAAYAVVALVVAPVEVAPVEGRPPDALDRRWVPGVGAGADEVVEGEIERPCEGLKARRVAVNEVPRGFAGRLSSKDVLQRVVVSPTEETDPIARGAAT